MKKKTGTYILNIFTFVAGLIFILLHNQPNLMEYMVILIGLIHIVPSVAVIVNNVSDQKEPVPNMGAVIGIIIPVCAIFIGLALITFPESVINFIVYAMLLLIEVSGLYHILFMLMCDKKYRFNIRFYVLPVLPIIAGIALYYLDPLAFQDLIVLVTGISMILFTVNSIIEYGRIRLIERAEAKAAAVEGKAETEVIPVNTEETKSENSIDNNANKE